VIDTSKRIDQIPEWFNGCTLNYAENLLSVNNDDKIAIFAAAEAFDDQIRRVTFRELKNQVAKYASSLKKCGVRKGDRVAAHICVCIGYMPNNVECLVAMLAAVSLGAVWSSTSLDFGTTAVLDRLSQVEPKILFSVEATVYNGKRHDNLHKLTKIVQGTKMKFFSIILSDFLNLADDSTVHYEQVPFNHPLFIMFSSGTTGPPKCMVHSVGGTLLKHIQEHKLQSDLGNGDVVFFYTTVGWMMWNWLVSVLAVGAAIVLYDGSPFHPRNTVLFDLASKFGVTAMGMGAKCYAVFESNGLMPIESHDLTKLRILFSTGSPLKPQSYDYIYDKIKKDVLVASISGGTDIVACFIGSTWTLPVKRGYVQCPILGCQIESWTDKAKQIFDETGELVCTKPFPSMPTHFLNDPDFIKYKKAYFAKFQGVWAHGDFCIIDSKSGGILMLGRSDATLNPGGVRFGSAEIYHIVESFPSIADSVCVSQKISSCDERVVLFLKMKNKTSFTEKLENDLRTAIRNQLSARHVPAIILAVDDIPYTNSGKKVEIAVKRVINGESVSQIDHLANPESLKLYYDLPQLKIDDKSFLAVVKNGRNGHS
uniref:Acetoacetyl-CoA synthetase n=1 Tax=Romanomermis culicivorax TaxID=13658 RepID=A0A915HP10_ROMCU